MQRLLIIAYLALLYFIAVSVTLGSATRTGINGEDISPIFRRKPYKSTTESSGTSSTEETEATSEHSEDRNKFRVGAEHYYDNRIDIQKQNDDLDIDIDDQEHEGTNDSSEYLEYSDETEEEQYYYEDYVEGDPVLVQETNTNPEPDRPEKQNYRKQRLERLKLMQKRRRIWLERQRQRYYASMSKWRRKRPRVIISEAHKRPAISRPKRWVKSFPYTFWH